MNRRSIMTAALGVGLLGVVVGSQGAPWQTAAQSGAGTPQTATCLVDDHWGMMNDRGMMSAMWGSMGDMGMMAAYPATGQPITQVDAEQRAAAFAATCGAGIVVGDIIAFSSNFYASLVDSSGAGVGEVLVDRFTGAVYPAPGPNMMWNRQWGAGITETVQDDQAAAEARAATFLEGYLPGATVLASWTFPGYSTFEFGRDRVEGMLSVNAATGEVWIHTWLGPALEPAA